MIKGCADCNYKNFPPDAVPCVYCDAGDQFEPIEESEDEEFSSQ